MACHDRPRLRIWHLERERERSVPPDKREVAGTVQVCSHCKPDYVSFYHEVFTQLTLSHFFQCKGVPSDTREAAGTVQGTEHHG